MTAGATRGPNLAVLAGFVGPVSMIDLVVKDRAGSGWTLSHTDAAARALLRTDVNHYPPARLTGSKSIGPGL